MLLEIKLERPSGKRKVKIYGKEISDQAIRGRTIMTPIFSNNSGLSLDDAVIITGVENTTMGIAAENQFISQIYGKRGVEWFKVGQALLFHPETDKPIDRISIRLKDGKELDFYFEIGHFFGKF